MSLAGTCQPSDEIDEFVRIRTIAPEFVRALTIPGRCTQGLRTLSLANPRIRCATRASLTVRSWPVRDPQQVEWSIMLRCGAAAFLLPVAGGRY